MDEFPDSVKPELTPAEHSTLALPERRLSPTSETSAEIDALALIPKSAKLLFPSSVRKTASPRSTLVLPEKPPPTFPPNSKVAPIPSVSVDCFDEKFFSYLNFTISPPPNENRWQFNAIFPTINFSSKSIGHFGSSSGISSAGVLPCSICLQGGPQQFGSGNLSHFLQIIYHPHVIFHFKLIRGE